MKVAIIYRSKHKGNTKKLLNAIAARNPVTLINAHYVTGMDLSSYDAVGFATGVSGEKVYPEVARAINWLPEGKKVFFLYTCGSPTSHNKYIQPLVDAATGKGAEILGVYGCMGHYSFGPLRLFDGLKKQHPTEAEVNGAVKFYELTVLDGVH